MKMSTNRTKTETCEECGNEFMRFCSQKRSKRGWICSTACGASRRLKLYGRDCKQCGTRYVEQSIRKRNGGFCALQCKNAFMLNERMGNCEHCGKAIDRNETTRFCGKECYSAFKRSKASKDCMCCGKTWYRHGVTRKQSKYATSRFHNCFCSKRCAKKYQEFECGRKARCRCGLPTGESRVEICEKCRAGINLSALGAFSKCVGDVFDGMQNEWNKRCSNAVQSLKIRQSTRVGKEKQRKVVSTWEESILNQWKSMMVRVRHRNTIGWMSRIRNAVNLLGKRQRRKQQQQN